MTPTETCGHYRDTSALKVILSLCRISVPVLFLQYDVLCYLNLVQMNRRKIRNKSGASLNCTNAC